MGLPSRKIKIATYNKIAPEGLETFSLDDYQVAEALPHPDAILLRSHRLKAGEIGDSVLAIARAGAGVNNIPVDECTERGIVVFNAPGANANAVAELTLTVLLALRRRVPRALDFMREIADTGSPEELEKLVESQKKAFRGVEFYGSRLGVVGLGAIGSRLAHCAVEMGVEVLGYDPAISVENAWRLPANVRRCNSLEDLLSASDAVSLHVPLLPTTADLINEKTVMQMRHGALLLNYARGPIVNEQAVIGALKKGRIGLYASDFPTPELCRRSRSEGDVFLTPHLGASTHQAEMNSSVMAARQLDQFLRTGTISNSVNYPSLQIDLEAGWRLAIANQNIPRILGSITSELAKRNINVSNMANRSRESVAWNLIDLDQEPSPPLLSALRRLPGILKIRLLHRSE